VGGLSWLGAVVIVYLSTCFGFAVGYVLGAGIAGRRDSD